ncbi:MAG: DUF839 domain-containing protein [Chitinophagales bacterium]|nr:DUF839 domain-containing protein [Chitinophagales bacterium]
MRFLALFLAIAVLGGCNSQPDKPLKAGIGFSSIKNNFDNQGLLLPEGAVYDILYSERTDSVLTADGKKFPAKGKQDYLAYIPIDGSSEHGYLFVNHELRNANDLLGDGGGMSWFEVKKEGGRWKTVGGHHYITFDSLGGTWHNCGGGMTPKGTILSAEEYPTASNAELYHNGEHFRDTSDWKGFKRYEHMGWMVEVDPVSKKPLHKLYAMGRFSHEDVHCMPDGKTVYMTDDNGPGVFFKFVADNANDYTRGQLYAYQQSTDGQSGDWLALPRDTASLINAREVAFKLGATMFIGQEWVQEFNGKIYITETGGDTTNFARGLKLGGKVAHHLSQAPVKVNDSLVDAPYGHILVLDPTSNKMEVLISGGVMKDGGNFSQPDGLAAATINGKPYLIVCEDINGGKRARVSGLAHAKGEKYNEMYFLDLSLPKPTKDDLVRFSVGPRGCEETGPIFTPDGKTLFFVVQNPATENVEPFNRSTVVAVTGVF